MYVRPIWLKLDTKLGYVKLLRKLRTMVTLSEVKGQQRSLEVNRGHMGLSICIMDTKHGYVNLQYNL